MFYRSDIHHNFKFLKLILNIILGLFRVFRFPRARFFKKIYSCLCFTLEYDWVEKGEKSWNVHVNFALWSFGNWGFWLLNFRFLYHSILKNQILYLASLPQLKSRRGFERNFFKLCVWDDFIILRIGDVGWVRSDELWIYQIILNPIIVIFDRN